MNQVEKENLLKIQNVTATMAIEGMYFSRSFLDKMITVGNGELTSEEVRQEVIKNMPDKVYCYPNSDVLVNKLNIQDSRDLFEAEKKLTYIRLKELQDNPIKGDFNFDHLRKIHKYIFQDIYEWAGEVRSVEIGKRNLFCTTPCIHSYADSFLGNSFVSAVTQ